jgi:hypothetical protein
MSAANLSDEPEQRQWHFFIFLTYRCTGSKLVWWHAWDADVIGGGYRTQATSAVHHPDLASGEDFLDGQC